MGKKVDLIEALALRNIRPALKEDGSPADIVRKGQMAMLQVEELEHYVNIGAVEPPKYKYEPPEEPVETPEPKLEGGDV